MSSRRPSRRVGATTRRLCGSRSPPSGRPTSSSTRCRDPRGRSWWTCRRRTSRRMALASPETSSPTRAQPRSRHVLADIRPEIRPRCEPRSRRRQALANSMFSVWDSLGKVSGFFFGSLDWSSFFAPGETNLLVDAHVLPGRRALFADCRAIFAFSIAAMAATQLANQLSFVEPPPHPRALATPLTANPLRPLIDSLRRTPSMPRSRSTRCGLQTRDCVGSREDTYSVVWSQLPSAISHVRSTWYSRDVRSPLHETGCSHILTLHAPQARARHLCHTLLHVRRLVHHVDVPSCLYGRVRLRWPDDTVRACLCDESASALERTSAIGGSPDPWLPEDDPLKHAYNEGTRACSLGTTRPLASPPPGRFLHLHDPSDRHDSRLARHAGLRAGSAGRHEAIWRVGGPPPPPPSSGQIPKISPPAPSPTCPYPSAPRSSSASSLCTRCC